MAVTTHLREIRKSKGLTQKEVAEALLISKDSLSRYERGEQDRDCFKFCVNYKN